MNSRNKTYTSHNEVSWNDPTFEKVAWLNEPALDYKLLKNKGWMQTFALDVNCSAGATADWMYREVSVGSNWDIWTSYSQTILTWLGSTTALVTKQYDMVDYMWNVFKLPPWKVMEVTARLPTGTGLIRLDYTWSIRFLLWSTTDMSSTNTHIVFINSNTTTKDITLKFATGASDRPTFGIFIRIY